MTDTCSCGAPYSMLPADHVCRQFSEREIRQRIEALEAERDKWRAILKGDEVDGS